jgi:hypothetical protein
LAGRLGQLVRHEQHVGVGRQAGQGNEVHADGEAGALDHRL